jgi:predicted Zn-dependent protease
LAILYSYEGRLNEASDLLERVLNQQPRDRNARHLYVTVRGVLGGVSTAKELTREYLEDDLRSSTLEIEHRPTDFRAYVRSVGNARQLGRNSEALAFAKQANLHPPGEQFVGAWRALAYSACAMRQWDLAQFAIEQACELDPNAPSRWIEIAEVAFLAGDTDRSISWAQRVINEQPLCVYVFKAKAVIAHCLGDFENASTYLYEHLNRFPFASCSASQLADCRAELGDHQGAIDAWRITTIQDPLCACEWRQRAKTTMTRVGIRIEQ